MRHSSTEISYFIKLFYQEREENVVFVIMMFPVFLRLVYSVFSDTHDTKSNINKLNPNQICCIIFTQAI